MQPAVLGELELLYGESTAHALLPRIDAVVRARGDAIRVARRNRLPALPDEGTALVITYPDQVRQTGVPPLKSLATLLDRHLRSIVSGAHVLPFFPSSSDDGFSIIDYCAVDPAFGSWDDISSLGERFDLMVDGVINHVSARSAWFKEFLESRAPGENMFITVDDDADVSRVVRPRALPLATLFQTASGPRRLWTTFSPDQIDLDYHNPDVLLTVLDTLLLYVEKGARLIRLDAIAYLWKELGTPCIHLDKTHAIVRLIHAVLEETAPGVLLVTETNVPHADNVSYFGDGTNEAQLVYNFALPPLVLHAFHTGSATALARWLSGLVLPSARVTWLNFLASHDGIGLEPARGMLQEAEIKAVTARAVRHGGMVSFKQDASGAPMPYELNINYFDALSDPFDESEPSEKQIDRFMAAEALMLSLAGVPAMYVHSLLGSRGDRRAADEAGLPRRINRQKFVLEDLERELANPTTLRARVLERHTSLLSARRARRAFHPNSAQRIMPSDRRILALLRTAQDADEQVLCLHNISNEAVAARLDPQSGNAEWRDLLGGGTKLPDADGTVAFQLRPYEVIWALRQAAGENG